jgi:hypothetical protein
MANRAGFYPADLRSTRSAGTAGTTCSRTTCSSSAERLAHTEEAVGAAPTTSTMWGTNAAEHGWTCSSLIRRRSPVRSGVPRLRGSSDHQGFITPGSRGRYPAPPPSSGPLRRPVAGRPGPAPWGLSSSGRAPLLQRGGGRFEPDRLHPGRAGPRQSAGVAGTGCIAPLVEWPTRLPLKEEITGSNPVRGTSTAGGDHPAPTGGAPADVVERRHAGPKTRCREAWGCKSPRRHNASRPGGLPAFVPPGPGVGTPRRLWSARPTGNAEVVER